MKYFKKPSFLLLLPGIYGFIVGFAMVFIFCKQCCFLISETNSLQQNYFLHIRHLKPICGGYTVFFNNWINKKVIKKIVGVSGDQIWYDCSGALYVNDQKIGIPHKKSTNGQLLNPLKAQIIPKGYVFLSGNHELSFDSRYQEFGLVPLYALNGLVIPLL